LIGKGTVLAAPPYLPVENFKNKAPSLHGPSTQVTKAACRQASFKTEQPTGFEKPQFRKFWDSQPQCLCGRLTPSEVDIGREKFWWGKSEKH
jgi:hypothetical protein